MSINYHSKQFQNLNLKDQLCKLKKHARFWELIDMRKAILAKDCIYSRRLVSSKYFDVDKDIFSGSLFEHNHASDFELTKNDVKGIKSGRLSSTIIERLINDLGVLDNNPMYYIDIEPILDFKPILDDVSIEDLLNMFPLLELDIKMLVNGDFIFALLFFISTSSQGDIRDFRNKFSIKLFLISISLLWLVKIKPKKLQIE